MNCLDKILNPMSGYPHNALPLMIDYLPLYRNFGAVNELTIPVETWSLDDTDVASC